MRIPRPYADEAGLEEGVSVDLSVQDGQLMLRRAAGPCYTLAELLNDVTDANRHGEADWRAAAGGEAW